MRLLGNHRWGRWLAPVAWMGLIFVLSSTADYPNFNPPGWPDVQSIAAHVVIYAVLALLWAWALAGAGVRRPLVWAFVITALYGLSDEFHQTYVPGRSGNLPDLLTDATAAALALSIATWVRGRRRHFEGWWYLRSHPSKSSH